MIMTTGIIIAAIVIAIIILMAKGGRRITEDFEAKLAPTNANEFSRSGRGEVERELYADGNAELKLAFSGTNIPDGSTIKLLINRNFVKDYQVNRGKVYEKINTKSGITVPSVKAGDKVEIIYNDTVILSGDFYLD